MSPYEITFGKKPPCFPQYLEGASKVEAVDEWLTQRDRMATSLVKKLSKAQQHMKQIEDRHRHDVSYKEGDQVLVKLRPRRQTSVSGGAYSKLAKRFYGPFSVIKKIGKVAYQLQLPPGSQIHPVFHCSLLKPYHPSAEDNPATLPILSEDNQPCITPLVILDTKWVSSPTGRNLMVLVQWTGLLPEDSSWESWDVLKRDYNLEDKVVLEACRDVMNNESTEARDTEHGTGTKRKSQKPRYLRDYVAK